MPPSDNGCEAGFPGAEVIALLPTTLNDTLPNSSTAAGRASAANWAANLRALARTQPRLAEFILTIPAGVEWVFARDGELTAMEPGGRWWRGCSLPREAARYMLREADLSAAVICFLDPTYAAQLRVSLDRMRRPQAVVALVEDASALRVMLACDDFSPEIAAHRLWFAWGSAWTAELDRLFSENPGLPTPVQFVRPISGDTAIADAMVQPAQKIFADHGTQRAATVRSTRGAWQPGKVRRICLVAPSRFRLWDDAGTALADAFASVGDSDGVSVLRYDPDDPAYASPAALAAAAAECGAVVTPNTGRGDLPEVIPQSMPWVTWVTSPRIPSARNAGPRDALLVADAAMRDLAITAGWPAKRVAVAGWPAPDPSSTEQRATDRTSAPFLAIITDTRTVQVPKSVTEYSSHRLLWEAIHEELLENPFALGASLEAFLAERQHRAQVGDDGLDRGLFFDALIVPAYQLGIARAILREKLPLRCFGTGWERIEAFAPHAGGAVASRENLTRVASEAAALIHVWPMPYAHPLDALGRPVVRAHGRRLDALLRDARTALAGQSTPAPAPATVLSKAAVLRAMLAA